jgi:hypothetical protein
MSRTSEETRRLVDRESPIHGRDEDREDDEEDNIDAIISGESTSEAREQDNWLSRSEWCEPKICSECTISSVHCICHIRPSEQR